ncbi:MAG: hydroxymethylglutaryl-CoA reductase, degradative [Megasphaera sp.]|jgi:hydroxymethylglutaryl-CoA reductase|nr:hydroxymethylglutaryl-CoA reductase, degradative [Megasphaera sp.]
MKTNNYSGFHKLSLEQRAAEVAEFANLTKKEIDCIINPGALTNDIANNVIENVIGTYQLPMGVAMNFVVNGKEVLIPMVVEEASIVAAASNAAKMARAGGGFTTSYTGNIMIAQIQTINIPNPYFACQMILHHKKDILDIANEKDPILVKITGGAKDVEVRIVDSIIGPMVVTHLLVDTGDAMGANAVNTMAEAVAPFIEKITGGIVKLRILSNLAAYRLARATAKFTKEAIGGEDVVDGIIAAYAFAEADPFRAATSNKGIMNGIDPLIVATGNDWRGIESACHAYCSYKGKYTSMTRWEKDLDGNLTGSIEIPALCGLVGGGTKILPAAQIGVKILGVKTAAELAQIIAAVGLAQNFAAMRALATDGIQKGHMKLHARNIATVAGADGKILDEVVAKMVAEKNISVDYAKEIISKLK